MNNINLIGRLTQDPELKQTQNGKAVVKFSIAVNRIKKDEADFINCEAWEKQAELIAQYCRKGDRIGITGRLCIDNYEKEGERKSYTKVLVSQADFISDKKSSMKEDVKEFFGKTTKEVDDDFPF